MAVLPGFFRSLLKLKGRGIAVPLQMTRRSGGWISTRAYGIVSASIATAEGGLAGSRGDHSPFLTDRGVELAEDDAVHDVPE
jgi:hypothetical protein